MALAKGVVQAPSNISFSDGDEVNFIAGKQAEMLISPLHSELYTQTYRGNTFMASTTPAGLAIPKYDSTAPVVCLWNPIGSGVNASLQNIVFAYCSGTAVYASVGLNYVSGAGSTIATGAVFSAFGSNNCLVNGIVGGGNTTKVKVATAGTTTLSTAPTAANFFLTLGNINLEAQTGTAHGTVTPGAGNMPRGGVIVPPGTAIWLVASTASSALYATTICWAEIPA